MKFIDHNSPEKALINTAFNSLPYMDIWICSIIEGYIYEKVDKINEYGNREEYVERYGKKEGEYKAFWDNGNLLIQSYYKEGKLEGKCKMWHRGEEGQSKGQLNLYTYWKEGKKEGEHKSWFDNGKLNLQCYYKEGKLDGEFKQWWDDISENEQLQIQCYYKEGKRDGEYKWWWENGKINVQVHLKEDKLDGECKRWNEEGELIDHKIYANGNIVKDLLIIE